MISYRWNYFEVVINMAQLPIELSPPTREWEGGGGLGDCSIDPRIATGPCRFYIFSQDICPPYQKNLGDRSDLFWDPVQSGDVTWNFEKYLIDTSGVPLARFAPIVTVRQIYEGYIVPNKQMMKKNRHANVKSVSY